MSLKDITNISDSKDVMKRKRMSNGEIKEYHYSKSRKQFTLVFKSDSEKLAFETRLENLKQEHRITGANARLRVQF
ncbi:hypothetical protein DPMN_135205 [Dreissena polymorpha]|uniref:Uncharacterized protein n=1 Tax=Dreissena polymorpha TaxID=45954 RepID=A0A9D4FYK7_DREPO|nr:hypothetical protein DPMN_135205 [Dreissena polymorpha]